MERETVRDLGSIYTSEWFSGHLGLKLEYRRLAEIVHEMFAFRTLVDVGCGCGYVLERLDELGHEVLGFDGSPNALGMIPDRIRGKVDLMRIQDAFALGRFDLVLCTEVAEHLPSSEADTLVRLLCALSKVGAPIVLSAAYPGQGGHDHINEQPPEYWIGKMLRAGKMLDMATSEQLRTTCKEDLPGMSWFGKTLMVFR
jgi:2-polyprenyl-3-methyl-5-hydroxy-6-metoxy-1,4-benzoquinol methylase